MEYGAVDFITKPGGAISLNLHEVKEEIIEKVVAASGVHISKLLKVVAKPTPESIDMNCKKKNEIDKSSPLLKVRNLVSIPKDTFLKIGKSFVIIGTSTGGPRALQEVLTQIPNEIGVPILIVQHMPAGFTKSLANRLNGLCEITVKEAENGELLAKGTAYIAPGGKHLKMKKLGTSFFVHLDDTEPPRMGHRPSVDVLLESAAKLTDLNFVTVIMTGMGYDGRAGMELLKKSGRTITIAESAKTAVVNGMPKAIVDAGLADEIVDVHNISKTILRNLMF
jgi:two-component system chemotaxis response regulator CheB